MRRVLAICILGFIGSAKAQIPVTANDYTPQEIAAAIADVQEYQREISELSNVNAEVAALPSGAQIPSALERRRRDVIQLLELREYHTDESDRRLIQYLTQELSKSPNHPWAADWKMKIADAQKRLLRAPTDFTAPRHAAARP